MVKQPHRQLARHGGGSCEGGALERRRESDLGQAGVGDWAEGLGSSEIEFHSAANVFLPARAPRMPATIEKGM